MTTLAVYVALVVALVMPSHPNFKDGVKGGIPPVLSYTMTFLSYDACEEWNASMMKEVASAPMGEHFTFKAACQKFIIPEGV